MHTQLDWTSTRLRTGRLQVRLLPCAPKGGLAAVLSSQRTGHDTWLPARQLSGGAESAGMQQCPYTASAASSHVHAARLDEQLPPKEQVAGSSPAVNAILFLTSQELFCQGARHHGRETVIDGGIEGKAARRGTVLADLVNPSLHNQMRTIIRTPLLSAQ